MRKKIHLFYSFATTVMNSLFSYLQVINKYNFDIK